MIEHSEDHRGIVNHKELKDLLDKLPPPPDFPEPSLPKELHRNLSASNDSPEQSPKPPKRRPVKKKDKRARKHSLGEAQVAEVEPRQMPQFNPLAVVNRSEEFKKEFLRRLPLMFQEGEDVLVLSLGYSSIDCPGMLSEEKVLTAQYCQYYCQSVYRGFIDDWLLSRGYTCDFLLAQVMRFFKNCRVASAW